jgi:hypothetical protein
MDVSIGLLAELVHLFSDISEDVSTVACKLPVLLLVILGLLECLAQLGILLLQVLAVFCDIG